MHCSFLLIKNCELEQIDQKQLIEIMVESRRVSACWIFFFWTRTIQKLFFLIKKLLVMIFCNYPVFVLSIDMTERSVIWSLVNSIRRIFDMILHLLFLNLRSNLFFLPNERSSKLFVSAYFSLHWRIQRN